MKIYVDTLIDYGWKLGPSCHMFTDPGNLDALHQFAAKIGLKRRWFQEHKRLPHYDLTTGRREAAVKAGAMELTRLETVAKMNEWLPRNKI